MRGFAVFMDIGLFPFSFPGNSGWGQDQSASGRCRVFKAIKHFLSCRHALLSQMCMWKHFPDRLHVELRSGFSLQLLHGRACFHPSHTRMLCQRPALFPAAIQWPCSGSGFCRFVSRQLGLPDMHAAEKFPAFLLSFDGENKKTITKNKIK